MNWICSTQLLRTHCRLELNWLRELMNTTRLKISGMN